MRWQLALDNRVSIVVLALLLAYLIAAIAAHALSSILNKESGEIWANVYASWVVDVTFFTLVGLAVSLMGFRSPTEESFTERISMLYGGKREPQVVIQYIAGQIRKLAAYGERASRELVINEYNQALKAYRVFVRTTYTLRNILDDVPYQDEATLSASADTFRVTPPSPIGRILSIWFKEEKLTQAAEITNQGFSAQVPIRLEPGETSELKFEYELWIPVGEENWLMPQRATEVFEMALVSRCDLNPLVALADKPGQVTTLVFNQPVKLDTVQGVSPGEKIFRFKSEEPTAIQQTTP